MNITKVSTIFLSTFVRIRTNQPRSVWNTRTLCSKDDGFRDQTRGAFGRFVNSDRKISRLLMHNNRDPIHL